MEQGLVEEQIINQSVRQGTPLPARIANAPQLLPGLDFYYIAFLELCTCRGIGMASGPIPWTAVNTYAERYALPDEEFETFTTSVKRLDAAYLQYQDEKRKKDKRGG